MCKVLEYKKHIRNILDAIELGKFKRSMYRVNTEKLESNIIHKHYVSYHNHDNDVYPDYSYATSGTTKSQETRFDVDTFLEDVKDENSVVLITEHKELLFKFNPKTMDDIKVTIRAGGEVAERLTLKDFLTEEQYFMYNTLYDMPPFEELHSLLVMAHELRPELMRKKLKISGMLSEEFVDMESESFLFEVGK